MATTSTFRGVGRERITTRFFNVVQILSGSVPLIAIQVSLLRTPGGHVLHFTKVLDVYEEPDDEVAQENETYDENFWKKKSPVTLNAAQGVLSTTSSVYGNARLFFCKHSINIWRDGYNQMIIKPRKWWKCGTSTRYGQRKEEIAELLESKSIQYKDKYNQFAFSLSATRLSEESELLRAIAKLNSQWWTNVDESE